MKIENMERVLELIKRHMELSFYSTELSKEATIIYIGSVSMTGIEDKSGLYKANLHTSILLDIASIEKELETL